MGALIQKLAESSGNITFINDCAGGDWEEVTNYRQMIECLKYGEILADPKWDEETKTHKCRMGYFHAGQDIILELAIEDDKNLYIINICQ
jgi:hypothetical protein